LAFENVSTDLDENKFWLLEGMKNLLFFDFFKFFAFSFVRVTVRGFQKWVVWIEPSSPFQRNKNGKSPTVSFNDFFHFLFLREFKVSFVVAIKFWVKLQP
jgi:hypothetical protein